MPTVAVDAQSFCDGLENRYKTEEELENLMFDFGAEYDGEEVDDQGNRKYRVEVAANRYDLLCNEGIIRAFQIFLGMADLPQYRLTEPHVSITVNQSAGSVRPFVLGAILRDVTFNDISYLSFIDLQDKLHHNICRKRSIVSIGTHDLDKIDISNGIHYCAKEPKSIIFAPLNQEQVLDGPGVMALYSDHAQLKQYLPIIRDKPQYPVVCDSKDAVLSLPPIINSDYSKMSKDTKNVLIEITATDLTKAHICLHTLIAAFSGYCAEKYSVEPVKVVYPQGAAFMGLSGRTIVTPTLETRKFTTNLDYITKFTGIKGLNEDILKSTLRRMGLTPGSVLSDGSFDCEAPITRSDILHACDIAEDVAIAYGYNNLEIKDFPCSSEQPIQGLMHQVRKVLPNHGYNEVLNWGLGSISDNYEKFGLSSDSMKTLPQSDNKLAYLPYTAPVRTNGAKTKEFEVLRPSLLGGMLKCLNSNKHARLPVRLYELGGTAGLSGNDEGVKALNRAYACVLFASNETAGFEEIHGILDTLLVKLQCVPAYSDMVEGLKMRMNGPIYRLDSGDDCAFMENRNVKILLQVPGQPEVQIGRMGIIKPSVLRSFGLNLATSCLEITLQPLMDLIPYCDLFDE